ncbi:MAG TPA: hypothetical protein V6D28_14110 [Leptolyngbyaceae cyanobacterium]
MSIPQNNEFLLSTTTMPILVREGTDLSFPRIANRSIALYTIGSHTQILHLA